MAQVATIQPAGDERVVRPEDLFFSTTTRAGRIRFGNSVFVRMSAYSVDELTGAPHNIVRHPDMPAAVFKAMWDRLLSGKPMAGYVLNLAKDHKYYWVFATITPLGDGFLSVRMAPTVHHLMDPARELYRELRDDEDAALAAGLTRTEAAAAGEHRLEQRMHELGLNGYDEFMVEALSAEVAARAGLGTLRGDGARGHGPVAQVLAAATRLDAQLGLLVGRLDAYRELSEAVSGACQQAVAAAVELDRAATAAQQGSAAMAGSVPVLANVGQVMVGPCHQTVDTLNSLVRELGGLRNLVADLRFRIALARLHNDMVGTFAREVSAGGAPASSLSEVPLLCDALQEGIRHLAATMTVVNDKLRAATHAVLRAGELLNDGRRFLGKWRFLVLKHRVGGQLAGYIEPIDTMLADGHDQLAMLHGLAANFQAQLFPIDAESLETELGLIRQAVLQL
jgi:hypothetical protein